VNDGASDIGLAACAFEKIRRGVTLPAVYHYSSAPELDADALNPDLYRFETAELLTPALVIYPEMVRHNIAAIIQAVGGDPARWRPHVKTVKLGSMMKLLVEAGVETAKCATTLELLASCEAGFRDVLVSYPHMGRNAERIAEIAREFPKVRVSALVESEDQVAAWKGSSVDLFIDVNPGMDRTGIGADHAETVRALARKVVATGLVFRGLHFYDGNSTDKNIAERTQKAHARYRELLELASFLQSSGVEVSEIVTAGTPALPCAVSFEPLWNGSFRHQVSPGTVVYNDFSSLQQVPNSYGLKAAVVVVSRVVSHPIPGVATCDAGHKSVAVDSGVPHCLALAHPELEPLKPSEEHLPFKLLKGASAPALGEVLYLVPRHVCPTVNNFNVAVLVERGRIVSIEPVTARGREAPLQIFAVKK